MNYEIKDFKVDVLEKSYSVPVLVDFWAEWCGPCRMLGPILERLAERSNGTWVLAKLNTDENQEIAAQYGIRGIPNCKLFFKGKVINEFTGALPEKAVEEWLRKSVPSKFSEMIEKAKILLDSGKENDAQLILQEVQSGDINNQEVKVLLAKILLFQNPAEAQRIIDSTDVSRQHIELAESIRTISELINRLKTKNSFDESPVREKYISAITALSKKSFEEALQLFIEIIKEDRQYDDDGSRKACIAIFKYLGEENEISIKYRRDFSNALYI
ncbi:MAG: thioredoxin [Ignavibacteriaceae bacterium]|nr:thioredoxin [Ignavibacteriaceae bacterium]